MKLKTDLSILVAAALLGTVSFVGLDSRLGWAEEMPEFKLTVQAAKFTPTQIKVPTGKKFKLVVENKGPGAEEFESTELNREKVIPPGQSTSMILGPLSAGTYEFFGDFHPETARGQIIAQ